MKTDSETAMAALCELLSRIALDTQDEKHAQHQLVVIFNKLNITFEREYAINEGFVDFFFPNTGVALELKANHSHSKSDVYRQCERYCAHPDVKGLVLATGKHQGLPSTIKDKPTLVHLLGEGTL